MLFKILHGDSSRVSLDVTPFHEGWAYVTYDGYFYIDLNTGTEEQPNNQRLKLNAGNCETLAGKTWEEIQAMIPTKVSDLENDAEYITSGEKEINSEAAYIKNVPESASSIIKVNEIGGMTRKCTNLFAYNTFVANGYTMRFNVNPGEILYCAEVIDFPMQWGVYDVNGALIGTFYDFGFTNSSPLTVPSNASYVEVKAYSGQQGTYTQDGVCVGIPNGDSEHVLLICDECYGVLNKGSIIKIGAGYYTVIEDASAGDAEIEIQISPALANSDINGEAYLATANEVQTAMQKYTSLYIGYEPYFEGLRSAPVTEAESVGANRMPIERRTHTTNGITFVVNKDGSVTANGTATDNAYLNFRIPFKTSSNTFFLSGCPSGGSPNTYEVQLYLVNEDGSTGRAFASTGNSSGLSVTLSENERYVGYIVVRKGATVNNLTFYPMLNEGTTALPYTPYQKHTLSIPEAVQALDGYGLGVDATYNNCVGYTDNKRVFEKWVKHIVFDGVTTGKKMDATDEQAGGKSAYYAYILASSGVIPLMRSPTVSTNNIIGVATNTVLSVSVSASLLTLSASPTATEITEAINQYLNDLYVAGNPAECVYVPSNAPEVIDISDLLPADNILSVEAGGTVTMRNEYGYDVPNTVTFYLGADKMICAPEFVGNLTGKANRAVSDEYGNNIAETYAKKSEGGSGDMLKATYDTNGDGVVDGAEKLATARNINGVAFDGTGDITVYSPQDFAPLYSTLSTAGWYRIAEIAANHAFSCRLDIGTLYMHTTPEVVTLNIVKKYGIGCNITQTNHIGSVTIIPKIRAVQKSGETWYLEVYYGGNTSNPIYCSFTNVAGLKGSGGIGQHLSTVNFTAGEIPEDYTATEFELSENPIKASAVKTGVVESTAIIATHPTGGEAIIKCAYENNKYVSLWGNNSTGTRGMYDTKKGHVVQVTDAGTTFYGNATTATTATKATQDGDGNTISTYYMKRGTYERIQGTSSERKDLNNYTTAGFYNVKTPYTDNCPSGIGEDAVLLVYPWDSSGWECQEITETAVCTTSRRWIRHKKGEYWTAWVEIITSQNIASQSVASATTAQALGGGGITATYNSSTNTVTFS